jgi:hypothetical protein
MRFVYSEVLGALGPTQPPMGGGSFPGCKEQMMCDPDHSPPSSAEVVKE